ncbi:Ectoine hydroxylase-related dioxygenase, phytanoyl-CoA dioxygenase (PhyH) family [Chitinophaga rupis]|uniref:Ectoine hydroxylase-related dioxygenase, phytanoyl-CoA dioxygenase (PhyH) family n=1 Tax=Chitinophaga rupis TaxID=573321 RepID=A0A1H7M018_9BACT|nr:phytanoyl-CoA dioxygenase family protein [Chitinophaga rupis]SEL04511.1 Ectoine hydroxylase-related dioxygenase, phytanoyl-CoA dioxygenase (PhyH) family [Chitinophaga rupis]
MHNQYPVFTLNGTLTDEQQAFFAANGFIHFKQFLSPADVQDIINAADAVQQKWISEGVEKVNGVPIKYGKDLNGQPIVQRFAFINQHSSVLADLLRDPRLNALLELIGPDARIGSDEKDGMVFNHYVNGPLSKFTKLGWHTDGLRDLFYGTRLNPMLNVGIHLSTQHRENGGLRIIPGTHQQNLFNFLFRKLYFLDHSTDPDEVAILPTAGDLTVHDGRLWHRVAQSQRSGEESRRRVIYVPLIAGKYAPRNEYSPTLFYQRFAGLVK